MLLFTMELIYVNQYAHKIGIKMCADMFWKKTNLLTAKLLDLTIPTGQICEGTLNELNN